jgi:hypothetical protein
MQKNLVVTTQAAGIVRINCRTGRIYWEQKNLDPVLKQYAKKYLLEEGFVEQALGVLDPEPDKSADFSPDDVSNLDDVSS